MVPVPDGGTSMNQTIRASFVAKYLDPSEILGEILFGLIMVLSFTLGAGLVIAEGDGAIKEMLLAVVACNIAWGIIDAGMYLMTCVFERSRNRRLWRAVKAATGDAQALAIVHSWLEPQLGAVTSASTLGALSKDVLGHLRQREPDPAPLRREDWYGAVASFWPVVLSTIPAVLPFLIFDLAVRRAPRVERPAARHAVSRGLPVVSSHERPAVPRGTGDARVRRRARRCGDGVWGVIFDIGVIEDEAPYVDDDGWTGVWARIALGEFDERFIARVAAWQLADYEGQWLDGARRLIDGARESCFVADAGRLWWTAWREGQIVLVQQRLLVEHTMVPARNADAASLPYELVGPRRTHSEQNEPYSEWQVTIGDLVAFVGRRCCPPDHY